MAKSLVLACPHCRRLLRQETGQLACRHCDKAWPVVEDVPHFIAEDQYWGEIDKTEMGQINHQIRRTPWRAVLLHHPSAQVQQAAGMMMNLDRANWYLEVPIPRESTVLDIGAGSGAIAHAMALHYEQVIAVEPVIERIEFMKHRFHQERLQNVTLIRSQATMLPFAANTIDLAILNGVLEWVPWSVDQGKPRDVQLATLATIYNVLRPGGFVCVGIENRWNLDFWLGANDPHADIPYVTILPRFLADWYSRRKLGKPYRNYLYSIFGYRRLLKDAAFSQVQFFCAIPSYNHPKFIIPFNDTLFSFYHEHFDEAYGHVLRRLLRRLFRYTGLDKYMTYSFFILARKADANA